MVAGCVEAAHFMSLHVGAQYFTTKICLLQIVFSYHFLVDKNIFLSVGLCVCVYVRVYVCVYMCVCV